MTFFWLKAVHTLITVVNSAAVLYILYCGLRDRRGPLLNIAIALVIIEGVALAAAGWMCPLQLYARRLTGSDGYVRDLFLPEWVAGHIVEVFTPIAIIGLALVIRNHLRRKPGAAADNSR